VTNLSEYSEEIAQLYKIIDDLRSINEEISSLRDHISQYLPKDYISQYLSQDQRWHK